MHDVLIFQLDLLSLFCDTILEVSGGRDSREFVVSRSVDGAPAAFLDPIVFVVIALEYE